MYLESWHIKKEMIKAIESTNFEEGELLIIKIKLKEFAINVLNAVFGISVLGVIFGLGGLIFGGDATAKAWSVQTLLLSLPASAASSFISDKLKHSIINGVSDSVKKRR